MSAHIPEVTFNICMCCALKFVISMYTVILAERGLVDAVG